MKQIGILTVREFDSKQEREQWMFPKKFPCIECDSDMDRVDGTNFHKYCYECSSCEHNVCGPMRTEIDGDMGSDIGVEVNKKGERKRIDYKKCQVL